MERDTLLESGNALLDWMRSIRRTLHQNPELSYQEYNTSRLIQEKLTEMGIDYRNGWGGTGVIASIGDKSGSAAHVALRADMDALPVADQKLVDYASRNPGVMHACGHDGHVAMLLGAAALLKDNVSFGRVSLIFQPAEEHGNGAKRIIEEGALSDGIKAVFAGHIDTHFGTGTITVDEGLICSFADPFSIRIKGKSGHAARPHEANDAVVAGAYLVIALQTLISRKTDPNQPAVLTVGRFYGGNVHNVIAEEALLEGTVRSGHKNVRNGVLAGMQRIIDGVALQFDVHITLRFEDCLPAVINSGPATRTARQAAKRIVGGDHVISQGSPSLGAEDFAFYQQVVDGCLVRFGANTLTENSPSHSGTFDFDENVLAVGAAWLASVAMEWLAEHQE
ncbi:MAG: M20 metallopeptidase family protein [Desulforhopalus sp.]